MGVCARLDGTMEILPLTTPVYAKVRVPGSKSYTNRALIMAALTKGPVCLKNPLYSEDTEAMIGCLRGLGLRVETEDQIVVQDDVGTIQEGRYELFARDSGTTARFMLPLLCVVPGVKILRGSQRLNERPIHDLVEALRSLGAEIAYLRKEGELPVRVTSSSLRGGGVELKGDLSSQFCSALLLVAPALAEGLRIHLQGPLVSMPYVDMTAAFMREAGVEVSGEYRVPPLQRYQKKQYEIEGDFSSAGYFFAIAKLTKSTITVENLNPNSLQADRQFLGVLEKMGTGIAALDVNMEDCPDQVMTLAVLAAFAKGVTRISGVRSLRVKETERVVALKTELGKMGIRTEDTHDTLTIYGGEPRAAEINTYGDHRIAMAFAVAGMRLPGMVIRHPEVVRKTFPNFWDVLRGLA